mgnify:CR=1 FL=1
MNSSMRRGSTNIKKQESVVVEKVVEEPPALLKFVEDKLGIQIPSKSKDAVETTLHI